MKQNTEVSDAIDVGTEFEDKSGCTYFVYDINDGVADVAVWTGETKRVELTVESIEYKLEQGGIETTN